MLQDSWLGPVKGRVDTPKIEQCRSLGDLSAIAADPIRPKRALPQAKNG